ncbi:MAG: helix-turn-helix domain-containing protein [Rubrobacteraceae bacterium]
MDEATKTMTSRRRPVGELLRRWRGLRRMSQFGLALEAGVSSRHVSFVENGKSEPSRDMVLRLAESLDLPLRERNDLLLAAGYAPVYSEANFDSPEMSSVRGAVRKVLAGHEPYPAVVVDRIWNLVDMNEGASLFVAEVSPELLEPPANVLRISLHPDGMASCILNLGEWRAHILGRLRRQVYVSDNPALASLLNELREYPGGEVEDGVPGDGIVVPLRIVHAGHELSFFGTVATFGTPLDVTVAELAIESFFPADKGTAMFLRGGG